MIEDLQRAAEDIVFGMGDLSVTMVLAVFVVVVIVLLTMVKVFRG
jgi:hypothetical protein